MNASKQRIIAKKYLVANKIKEDKEKLKLQKLYSKRFYKEIIEGIKSISREGGTFLRQSTFSLNKYLPGALDVIEAKLTKKGFIIERKKSYTWDWENWKISW